MGEIEKAKEIEVGEMDEVGKIFFICWRHCSLQIEKNLGQGKHFSK